MGGIVALRFVNNKFSWELQFCSYAEHRSKFAVLPNEWKILEYDEKHKTNNNWIFFLYGFDTDINICKCFFPKFVIL